MVKLAKTGAVVPNVVVVAVAGDEPNRVQADSPKAKSELNNAIQSNDFLMAPPGKE